MINLNNLCKLPGCPHFSMSGKEYCRKHEEELERKKREYNDKKISM